MNEFNAARQLDVIAHDASPSGFLGVPIGPCGQPAVLIGGMPAAHVYCTAICLGTTSVGIIHSALLPKPAIMINGAATVLFHGVPANRVFPSGDISDCGVHIAPPGAPTVQIGGPGEDPASSKCLARTLMKTGGHGTISDCDLVAAEMGKLPPHVIDRFRDKGITIVACRGSITDYRTELKGVHPRGWPPGSTWDSVPGVGGGNECVIAIRGHDTPAGAHVPVQGEGHGSSNLVIHESFHSLDDGNGQASANDQAFNNSRNADSSTLSPYESQAGTAGQQETYAESAARYYEGDPSDAANHPSLHSYWASDPMKPTP